MELPRANPPDKFQKNRESIRPAILKPAQTQYPAVVIKQHTDHCTTPFALIQIKQPQKADDFSERLFHFGDKNTLFFQTTPVLTTKHLNYATKSSPKA
jgi:hypothetical protein